MTTSRPRRAALERASTPLLHRLARLPRWIVAALMAVLVVTGLAVTGPLGAACLVVLAVFLGWLLALSWPVIGAAARTLRLGVVLLLLAAAVWQLTA